MNLLRLLNTTLLYRIILKYFAVNVLANYTFKKTDWNLLFSLLKENTMREERNKSFINITL